MNVIEAFLWVANIPPERRPKVALGQELPTDWGSITVGRRAYDIFPFSIVAAVSEVVIERCPTPKELFECAFESFVFYASPEPANPKEREWWQSARLRHEKRMVGLVRMLRDRGVFEFLDKRGILKYAEAPKPKGRL